MPKSSVQKLKGVFTLDHRPFNHEWYGPLRDSHKSKTDAQATAKAVRRFGIKSRVVKTDQGYTVFCNEADTKKAEARGLLRAKRR